MSEHPQFECNCHTIKTEIILGKVLQVMRRETDSKLTFVHRKEAVSLS